MTNPYGTLAKKIISWVLFVAEKSTWLDQNCGYYTIFNFWECLILIGSDFISILFFKVFSQRRVKLKESLQILRSQQDKWTLDRRARLQGRSGKLSLTQLVPKGHRVLMKQSACHYSRLKGNFQVALLSLFVFRPKELAFIRKLCPSGPNEARYFVVVVI